MSCEQRIVISPQKASFCDISGDEDLYGLGLRLGAYLIWASSILSISLAPTTAELMCNLNASFQGATLITLAYLGAAAKGSVFALESYILLILCFGGIFTSIQPPSPISLRTRKIFSKQRVVTPGQCYRLMIATACSTYGVWFAFAGLDNFCKSICTNDAFFFAKVYLYDWYHGLLKALFCISTISFGTFFLWSIFTIIKDWRSCMKSWTSTTTTTTITTTSTTKSGYKQPRLNISATPLILGTIVIILFVAAVEFTIFWNHIGSVNSVHSLAQLLPLVVGVACLCRTAFVMSVNLKQLP